MDNLIADVTASICRMDATYTRWSKDNGITYSHLMVLSALNEMGPCAQHAICEEWALPKQTVNTVLAELRDAGLASVITNPDNRRQKIVELTAAGHAYAAPLLDHISALERRALARMNPTDREAFGRTNRLFAEYFSDEVARDAQGADGDTND